MSYLPCDCLIGYEWYMYYLMICYQVEKLATIKEVRSNIKIICVYELITKIRFISRLIPFTGTNN